MIYTRKRSNVHGVHPSNEQDIGGLTFRLEVQSKRHV